MIQFKLQLGPGRGRRLTERDSAMPGLVRNRDRHDRHGGNTPATSDGRGDARAGPHAPAPGPCPGVAGTRRMIGCPGYFRFIES